MKSFKVFLAVMLAFVAMSSCAKSSDVESTKVYPVQSFAQIEMDGVGSVYFTQSDSYSARAEGDSILVSNTVVEVKDGCLKIYQKKQRKNKGSMDIYVTAPTLVKVETEGVGTFSMEQPVTLDNDFDFKTDGVGAVKIANLTCKNLNFKQDGVGAADVKVKCENATFRCDGVGACSIDIEAETLDLKREGVGAAKVKGHVKNYTHHSGGVTSKITDKDLKVGE